MSKILLSKHTAGLVTARFAISAAALRPSVALRLSSSSSSSPPPSSPSSSSQAANQPESKPEPQATVDIVPAAANPQRQETIRARVSALLVRNGGRWTLTADGHGIERTLRFRTFKQAKTFMVALFAEVARCHHHPDLRNCYNTVGLLWTTHRDPQSHRAGLTALDAQCARRTDELAEACGEVVVGDAESLDMTRWYNLAPRR